jgi:O-antigen ligase
MTSEHTTFFKQADIAFLILLLFSIVFVPFIPLSDSFYLSVEEILLVYPVIRLGFNPYFKFNLFTNSLLLFSGYIVFTIFLNGHQRQLNEYFEVIKIIKLLILFWFFVSVFKNEINQLKIVKAIHIIFILSFILNLLHFFDFFNFTRAVLIYYDPSRIDVLSFGLDSLGNPSSKRIVGTFGNPNENGFFFLLLTAFYSSRIIYTNIKENWINYFGFIGSSIMVLLTQSRTSVFILAFLLLVHIFFHWKHFVIILGLYLFLFGIAFLLFESDVNSLSYISNTHVQSVSSNTSVMGRLEVWKLLFNEWIKQPIFGYGPNKNYLYEHQIYPENEYIFFLWRYGVIGLIAYLYFLFQPIILLKKNFLQNEFAIALFLILAITALTNIPMFNMKFTFFIAICFGYLDVESRKQVNNVA